MKELPAPYANTLQLIARAALTKANESIGNGNWTTAVVSLQFMPGDGGVETVFQIDQQSGEPRWSDLPTEVNLQSMELGQMTEALPDPWRGVDIQVRPDGACNVRVRYGKREAPADDQAFRQLVADHLPPWIRDHVDLGTRPAEGTL